MKSSPARPTWSGTCAPFDKLRARDRDVHVDARTNAIERPS